MEYIEYGVADNHGEFLSGVEFDVINTLSYERTAVFDAAKNYLWHRHDALVEVNWQPSMTSYVPDPDDPTGLTPLYQFGVLPGATDLAILSYLLQPRRFLRITAGDSVIVQSPAIQRGGGTRLPCDCTNGPTIEVVGVPRMIGFRHWVCTLRIITDVRDQVAPGTNGQNMVISNLWVCIEDIDFQRRSTRRFAGRATLRADTMRLAGLNSNSFRDLYLFPCPAHYQRQNVHVQISEDGATCDWSFDDVMRGYDLGIGSPIVEIECFRTGHVRAGSPGKIVSSTARYGAQFGTMAAGMDVISAGTSLVTAAASAAILAVQDNLPKSYVQCRCDLTGDRNADLGRLSSIAFGIVMNQIGLRIGALLTGTAELTFRQDLADQVFTSVELTVHWTDDALFVGAAALNAVGAFNVPQALQLLQNGSIGLVRDFLTDSRQLGVAAGMGAGLPNANVAADRTGTLYNDNPAFTQGAFGVIPSQAAGTVPGLAGSAPQGSIPNGVAHLISQALLGQGVTPPLPGALVNDS